MAHKLFISTRNDLPPILVGEEQLKTHEFAMFLENWIDENSSISSFFEIETYRGFSLSIEPDSIDIWADNGMITFYQTDVLTMVKE